LSLETGKRIVVDENWSITPQVQLAYSSVDFDDFTDPFGADVWLDKSDSLKGRLGAGFR
jgi:outer membrane autotransporter protein